VRGEWRGELRSLGCCEYPYFALVVRVEDSEGGEDVGVKGRTRINGGVLDTRAFYVKRKYHCVNRLSLYEMRKNVIIVLPRERDACTRECGISQHACVREGMCT
jgi:hypothetical protein